MEKEKDFSVKIFYINPIETIGVIIDTLINMEYEVYTINEIDKNKLLKILSKKTRNIIFFTLLNKNEIGKWLEYIAKVKSLGSSNIQMGAFCYDTIDEEAANKFLENGVPIIKFGDVASNTLQIIQQVLTTFEAKGKRAFIRAKTFGITEAYFYFKNRDEPIICKILDISAYAFSIEINPIYKLLFVLGSYLSDVLLVLQGVRIRTAVKVLGFSNENPNIYIVKFCSTKMQNNKVVYVESIPKDIGLKVHVYIKKCLKNDITKQLVEVEDD